MLRPVNLIKVYNIFPSTKSYDEGSLKRVDFTNPYHDFITYYMLIEAERFWAAALLQFLATRKMYESFFHTWGKVTFYYAQFFLMNSVLRLCGNAIIHQDRQAYKIERISPSSEMYSIKPGGRMDHKGQWDLYYELIKKDITDDPMLKQIFTVHLSIPYSESDLRGIINYNLGYGYDERYNSKEYFEDLAHIDTFIGPLYYMEDVLKYCDLDEESEIAGLIYVWKHLKIIFQSLASNTGFKNYWEAQSEQLRYFINVAPVDKQIQGWFINELS